MHPENRKILPFDRKERIVLLIFFVATLCLILVLNIKVLWQMPVNVKGLYLENLERATEDIEQRETSVYSNRKKSGGQKQKRNITYFIFNPDTLTVDDWIKLGFSEKQGNALIKYGKSMGGYSEETFKSSFVIDSLTYRRLAPYIRFDRSNDENRKTGGVRLVDIQSADTSELRRLYGIGPVLSKRIFDYRNKLGGFYSVEQLQDVYGIKDDWFQKNKSYLYIGDKNVRKINVNTASLEEMKSHPYIGYKFANAIVKYRENHGYFETSEQLINIRVVDENQVIKLEPYIVFDK